MRLHVYCEGSDILPHLQAKKLDRHGVTDTGRKRMSPGSETKGFMLVAQQIARVPAYLDLVPELDSFRVLQKGPCVHTRNFEFRVLTFFIMDSSRACPPLQRETLFLSPKANIQTSL